MLLDFYSMSSLLELQSRFLEGDVKGVLSALDGEDEEEMELGRLGLRVLARLENGDLDRALEDVFVCEERDEGNPVHSFRRGVICFRMDSYEAAATSFANAKTKCDKGAAPWLVSKVNTWQDRVKAVLEDGVVSVKVASVGEKGAAGGGGGEAVVTRGASEKGAVAAKAASVPPTKKELEKMGDGQPLLKAPRGYKSRRRVEHYQTDSMVCVTLYVKGVEASSARVEVVGGGESGGGGDGQLLRVHFRVPKEDGSDGEFEDWDHDVALWGAVHGTPQVAVRRMNVEVTLSKASQGRWPSLERSATSATAVPASSVPLPAPPSFAAAATTAPAKAPLPADGKDWDKMDHELEKEEEEETPEGDEALHKLFRSIYSKADDDTRRAMVKSFQTSGGTVLSTNWGEVEKTDYEKDLKPPDGMEIKKYEY